MIHIRLVWITEQQHPIKFKAQVEDQIWILEMLLGKKTLNHEPIGLSYRKLTDEENSETSMHVKPRLIFPASLFVASMTVDHSSAAAKPTAFGWMMIQMIALFLGWNHCWGTPQPKESRLWFSLSNVYRGQRLSAGQNEHATEGLTPLQHGMQKWPTVSDLSILHIYGRSEVKKNLDN